MGRAWMISLRLGRSRDSRELRNDQRTVGKPAVFLIVEIDIRESVW